MAFGWKVIKKLTSSWAEICPLLGTIVKYFEQKVVSQTNLQEISPKLAN